MAACTHPPTDFSAATRRVVELSSFRPIISKMRDGLADQTTIRIGNPELLPQGRLKISDMFLGLLK